MFKVAFWFDAPVEYSGGLNYVKNLLYALSLVNDGSVRPYVFFGADVPADVEDQFSAYATVVKTRLLQRGTAPWIVHKVLYKVLGSMVLANTLLKSHGIAVLSHVWFVYKGRCPFPILGWIPDFQYLHLPELFPTLDPVNETRQNRKIIAQSDIVILSSHNAFEDFARIAAPEHRSRGRVLQFVSQPHNGERSHAVTREALERKYGFAGRFFFLPNQFWAHKNHIIVFRAVKVLKESGIDVLVLCTGNVKDYRIAGTGYVDSLHEFIEAHGLQNHVKILGHIDYSDVLSMMKNSVALLNPSRFEGWSSSVEEAKSMGKPVILSRIEVHLEQQPAKARYFGPDDVIGLSEILADAWTAPADVSQDEAERTAREALRARTVEFGNAYLDLLRSVRRAAPRTARVVSRSERSVSVCMATYNGAKYVSRQLRSILDQLADDDEVIVVDDCSTDGTVEVVKQLGDRRIAVHVNDRNRGEVFSFGRAMQLAKNDFVFLSDQDDIWMPGRVSLMQRRLVEAEASVVSSNFKWIAANEDPIEVSCDGVASGDSRRHLKNIVDIFIGKTNYYGCAMALRREFVPIIVPIPRFVESHDLWIALASNLAGSNVHIDDSTLLKRKHGSNVTSTISTRSLFRKLKSRMVFAMSLVVLCDRRRRLFAFGR